MLEYRIIDGWKPRGGNEGNGSISSGGTVFLFGYKAKIVIENCLTFLNKDQLFRELVLHEIFCGHPVRIPGCWVTHFWSEFFFGKKKLLVNRSGLCYEQMSG